MRRSPEPREPRMRAPCVSSVRWPTVCLMSAFLGYGELPRFTRWLPPLTRSSACWTSVGPSVRAVGAAAEGDAESRCEIGVVLHRAADRRDVEVAIGHGQV